ncbi:MAG: acyl-CoA dehydrogenase family protein [Acidimicrobiales bacterium]
MSEQPGRDDLLAWRATKPINYFDAVPALATSFDQWMGPKFTPTLWEKLRAFGEVVATEIEPAVQIIEFNREFPKLHSYDEPGQHIERIEFHPGHNEAARAAWASGVLATPLNYEGAFELAGLFFLLSHVGEGGQACPIVCTIGLRRALEHRASPSLKDRYLAGLTETDASVALRGSQFLTEVQGGSDVGAIATVATPDVEIRDAWRLSGEKWFCSVADADLFAVVARPTGAVAGTKGLGCFLVPRSIDGVTPNGFHIRRLKDKLGTRGLASAEIDFEGALAYPIGDVGEGFNVAVTELLNTSRWLNALGSTGIMSRVFIEASTFAKHRTAFGKSIDSYDGVREQLAIIKVETAAALASTLALTELVGKIDEGVASPDDLALHRFLVNANKYVTSITASEVVHRGIEVLGGNGTIEDFSPLPRLYRDAVVFESWEGTHNVLCAQVRRDCAKLGLDNIVFKWLRNELLGVSPSLSSDVDVIVELLEQMEPALTKTIENSSESDTTFRHQLTVLTHALQATGLLKTASFAASNDECRAIASLFVQLHLVTRVTGEKPAWSSFVDAVLK